MNDETTKLEQAHSSPAEHAAGELDQREEQILDTALRESDQLLARSLHDDEARRRRRLVLSTLLIGGVAMTVILIALVMGWLTLGTAGESLAKPTGENEPTLAEIREAEKLAAAGWELWKKREMVAAEEKFEGAVALDPEATNAWNGLGWARFNSGQAENAIEAFEACLELEPKHPAALNGMGQIHFFFREYDDAKKYLLRAAKQNASAAWWGLARTYLLTEEFPKARRWAAKIVKQTPGDAGAQEMLAAAKAGVLSDDLRVKIEPRGQRRKPKKPAAIASEGEEGADEAEDEEAEDDLEIAGSTGGQNDFQVAWKRFFSGSYRESEKLFRRVLKDDPENPHAMNGLGWSLLNQGKHKAAKPLLEKSLEIEPKHWGAMNGLAVCLKKEGDLDGAAELWEKIAENSEGPNDAVASLADVYVDREQYEKARECYEQLTEWYPDNRDIARRLRKVELLLAKEQDSDAP